MSTQLSPSLCKLDGGERITLLLISYPWICHGLEHLRLGVDLGHDGVGQVTRVDLPLQEVGDQLVARLPATVRKALGPESLFGVVVRFHGYILNML